MIPETITLDGFLSYRSRVAVDLSRIKVACVSGANGAGKSTLFDAITWALFGRARRNDDALIHNKVDSCQIVFEFTYENNRYRVDRAKTRGKSTTLEFQVKTQKGLWKPLTEAGVRATEERIRDVLRLDYDTFVNASFFLQGKADMFAVQPAGKRKEILSSILGLGVWDTYRAETAKRRREAQKDLEVQQSIIGEINSELDEEDIRVEGLAREEEMLAAKVKLRESKKMIFEQVQAQANQLKSEEEKLNLFNKQVEVLKTRQTENMRTLASRKENLVSFEAIIAAEESIKKAHQDYQQIRVDLTSLNATGTQYFKLNLRKTKLMGNIQSETARLEQELRNLEAKKMEIDSIQKEQPRVEKELIEKENESARLHVKIEKIDTLEKELETIKREQSTRVSENNQLHKEMDEIKERIDHLSKASGSSCPLCGQLLTDDHKEQILEKLNLEGKEAGDYFRSNKETIASCEENHASVQNEINKLRALRSPLTNLMSAVAVLQQRLAENVKKIEGWKSENLLRLQEVSDMVKNGKMAPRTRSELVKLEEQMAVLGYSPDSHSKLRKEELALRDIEEKYRQLEQARTALKVIKREIKELEKQREQIEKDLSGIRDSITTLEKDVIEKKESTSDIVKLETELHGLQREENHARKKVGAAQQLVSVLDGLRKRKIGIENDMQDISQRIARLKILETAFGKDGIQALLIESSIPQIEAQANEILDKLSGGDMSVSFETERAYADKKRDDKRQTLDIIIRDSAGSRAYELFSGGEAFRINFAIRLALSRVLAQRSGARLQTLVIDEGFGSQDAEGRQRLVEAINLVSSDFEKILVITHLDELKDAFPSQIEVTKSLNGSQVEVIL